MNTWNIMNNIERARIGRELYSVYTLYNTLYAQRSCLWINN